ncbi:MAG: glycosyltransferase family 4 protein [Flavobacteriales bacterium]
MKKLLLIGSNAVNAHLKNYLALVVDSFDEVLVVSNQAVDFAPYKQLSFSLKNPFSVRKSIKALEQIISDFQPCVIHVHQVNSYAFISGRANVKNIPMVLTAWGSDVLLLPKKSFLHRWLVKQGLKKADLVTADSYQMKAVIQQLHPGKEVVIANFGVDVDLSIPLNPNRINGYYSNRMHEPLYRIMTILSSYLELNDAFPGPLTLAGKGSLTGKLTEYASENNLLHAVHFVGFVTKTQNIRHYLESTFFISIPKSDGTSISLLEAMAYGCIPILSDIPANKEWVEDGVNGIIVRPHESLYNAVYRGHKLDLATVQEKNRAIILKRATKEANAAIFNEIYARIFASETKAKR